MERRTFIAQLALGVLAVACGSDDNATPTTVRGEQPIVAATCSTQTPESIIADNHGHSTAIPIGDITSEVAGTYDLGVSDEDYLGVPHTHTIILNTADMQTLKANYTFSTTSSEDDGHSHGVTVICVG
ncbi:MAG: hypothetical protein A2X86_20485 [Bdellovibrionales bacterium GWA2_49_15]|nr:MAG: hypothetical protein A2X86_20485 [Bdellovibrionales bacterium GWA2_49_15]HAZ11307.1 hypothetical protein [Bdellovibrionales bacterium]